MAAPAGKAEAVKMLSDPSFQMSEAIHPSFKEKSLEVAVMVRLYGTAAKNAHLAQIISPEIKLSTESIFYY